MNRLPLLLLLLSAATPVAAQSVDTLGMRVNTRFLSSDLLEGRGTGTRGEHIAAEYIASELMRIGAQPIQGNGYLQPIPLKRAIINDSATRVSLNGRRFESHRDFVWNTGGRGALRDFAGPLMYVGTADSVAIRRAPESRGHVVVFTGALGGAAVELMPALTRAGAAGVLVLAADSATYDLYARSRGRTRYYVDADVADPVWQPDIPVLIAAPLLSHAVMRNRRVPPFTPVGDTLIADFAAHIESVRSANIAAVIPGSDARRAHEYIAYSAHYDHLGMSLPDPRGDSIYNGFSDNAAGVAMLLAIGKEFKRQPAPRPILLLFFTGEERGLLGSSFFAAQPPLPLQNIRALINLDAGAPPAPPAEWRIAGGTASRLGETARTALQRRGWNVQLGAASPNSDYWPFLTRGVPSVFLIPGNVWEGVSSEQQAALKARWDRYHEPGDAWDPAFPFAGLARYAEAALLIGRAAAQQNF